MTKDEILKIKEHIEIHARKEPHAVEITKILRKAVAELEYLAELEKAYFELREQCTNPGGIKLAQETVLSTEYAIEELKKEAEEKAKKRTKGFACQENCEKSYVMGALDFAEPREKQIAELEKQIRNQAESLGVTLLEEEKKAERIKELENEVDKVKLKSGYSTYLEDKIQIDNLKKVNAVLKTQIEKMKRCQNCDNFDYTECKCKVGWCNDFEKWVLKEVVFVDLKELDDDN